MSCQRESLNLALSAGEFAQQTERKRVLRLDSGVGGMVIALGAVLVLVGAMPFSGARGLVYLFGYSFLTNIFVAVVPHEPGMIYFGKHFASPVVALVGGVATILSCKFDYHLGSRLLLSAKSSQYYRKSAIYRHVRNAFCRLPFLTLATAGFLPVPYSPFKFLAISSRYRENKYLAAVALGRTPRYYLLAALGRAFNVPNLAVITFLALLFVVAGVEGFRRFSGRRGLEDGSPA